MTEPGQTRDASGQTASRSNPQAQPRTRQAAPPSQQRTVPPAWDSAVAAPQSWEPAKDAAMVPVETGGSDPSIGFEWKQVAVETNRTCSCVISVDGGHALSVRVQQPPYDRTLKGSGSVNVAAIPVAPIGAPGRLVAKDEVSGATAEFTWEWKPASEAKWANPSRAAAQAAGSVQLQKGNIKLAAKAGLNSKAGVAASTQQKPAVQTAFFGMPATGHRFAFILDMSGSMMGARWSACVKQLAEAFEKLTEDTEIFVALFSDHIAIPTEQAEWLAATAECKKAILDWVASITPNGGTFPQPAFDLVFASPEGKPDVIYFLTDGLFTELSPERLARLCSGGGTGLLSSVKELFIIIQETMAFEPEQRRMTANEETIDNICNAFAEIIDAKSPFTYRHSNGVADAALEIGQAFGMSSRDLRLLRRAALLHDIGKLSVSNTILEKPTKLTDEEWKVVRDHPYFTFQILKRIPGFEELAAEAAAHHEKLDGSGYWQGWHAEQMSSFARILVVADIFDALRAKRPYRDSLPLDKVFQIMRADAPRALDLPCLEALIAAKSNSDPLSFGHAGQSAVSHNV